MAARLKNKNKSRVDYEPRSAHGRAVKNGRNESLRVVTNYTPSFKSSLGYRHFGEGSID